MDRRRSRAPDRDPGKLLFDFELVTVYAKPLRMTAADEHRSPRRVGRRAACWVDRPLGPKGWEALMAVDFALAK